MRIEPISEKLSWRLDAIRVTAAIGVVAGHVRALWFVPYGQVASPTPFVKVFYVATSLGHQSVMIFFVLSGFLISRSVLGAMSKERLLWRVYLLQRASRLWIVLIPALAVGGLLDAAGSSLFGLESPYHGLRAYSYILPDRSLDSFNAQTFFGNIAFLQGIRVPTFGTNGPLWSLAYEAWFYVLFPLLFISLHRTSTIRRRAIASVFLVAILAFVGVTISLYFLVWLLGLAVIVLPSRSLRKRLYLAWIIVSITGLSGVLLLGGIYQPRLPAVVADFCVALSFSVLLYSLVKLRPSDTSEAREPRRTSMAHALAGFSYTLYVVHFPVLVFIKAGISPERPDWQPRPTWLFCGGAIFLSVGFYAWCFALLTEAKTDRLRRAVQRRFLGRIIGPVVDTGRISSGQ